MVTSLGTGVGGMKIKVTATTDGGQLAHLYEHPVSNQKMPERENQPTVDLTDANRIAIIVRHPDISTG